MCVKSTPFCSPNTTPKAQAPYAPTTLQAGRDLNSQKTGLFALVEATAGSTTAAEAAPAGASQTHTSAGPAAAAGEDANLWSPAAMLSRFFPVAFATCTPGDDDKYELKRAEQVGVWSGSALCVCVCVCV